MAVASRKTGKYTTDFVRVLCQTTTIVLIHFKKKEAI